MKYNIKYLLILPVQKRNPEAFLDRYIDPWLNKYDDINNPKEIIHEEYKRRGWSLLLQKSVSSTV